jgi:hypothetical protein
MPLREFHAVQQAGDGFVAIAWWGILTGDHLFIDRLAKLAVNATN